MSKRFLPTSWGTIPTEVREIATVGCGSGFFSNLLPVQIGKCNYGDVFVSGKFKIFRFDNPDNNTWIREQVAKLAWSRFFGSLNMVLQFELCCPDSESVPDDFVPRIWKLKYTERD